MAVNLFSSITNKEKSEAIEKMITHSSPRQDFFFFVILAVLMATLGIMSGSVPVVIGSMLIAPILYPIESLAMGIVMSDGKLMRRSLFTLVKAIVIGLASAIIAALLLAYSFEGITENFIVRTEPSVADAVIAIIAGIAVSFAIVKPFVNETLPGIAISVSMIPPLAVVGISISKLNIEVMGSSLLLFLLNVMGIIFASVVIFSVMNFYAKRSEAQSVVTKEDKKIEMENNHAKEKAKEK